VLDRHIVGSRHYRRCKGCLRPGARAAAISAVAYG
jgi:hypothetical protein